MPIACADLSSWGGANQESSEYPSRACAGCFISPDDAEIRLSALFARSAYDIARQYHDEIVPLRKTIADENVLRYNGMLIGVFELLADSREQITSAVLAIDAQRGFWLADATLQAALIGRPANAMSMESSAPMSAGNRISQDNAFSCSFVVRPE